MFSHYISYLFEKLHFLKVVIARFVTILFRRSKKIELVYLNYNTEHLFENSYIIINYRFRNAIFYKFGIHKTLEKQIKFFNLKNFNNEFELTVYGLFQNKKYQLKFEPKLSFNGESFKTEFNNLNLKLEEIIIPKFTHPNIYVDIDKPILNTPTIKIKNKPIRISHKTFNQTDFI